MENQNNKGPLLGILLQGSSKEASERCLLADAHQPHPGPEGLQRSGIERQPAEDGGLFAVADAERDGRRADEPRGKAEGRTVDGRDSEAGDTLANAQDANGRGGECGTEEGIGENRIGRRGFASGRDDGKLGDPAQRGLGMCVEPSGSSGRAAQPEPVDGVEDSSLRGFSSRRSSESGQEGGGALSQQRSESYQLEHALQPGLEGHARDERDRNQPGRERADATRPATAAGESGNPWSNVLWLWCRDGKYRPVESCPTPVADGLADSLGLVFDASGQAYFSPLISKTKNRVGRLRAYGNAVVAEVAAQFIRAYMERANAR